MNKTGYFAMALIVLAILAGCKKNHSVNLQPNLNVANDQLLANRPFVYVFRMLAKAVSDPALQSAYTASIDSATVTLDAKKQKYTFSFHGDKCSDSTRRIGIFTAMVDSGFFNRETHVIITFLGYLEDAHQVTGSDSMVCNGFLNGQYLYDDFITGGRIGKDSAHTIQFGAAYQVALQVDVMVQGKLQTVVTFGGTAHGT